MKIFGFIILSFLTFFITSCGGKETKIEFSTIGFIGGADGTQKPDATEVPADGKSFIEITAKLTSASGEVWPGTPVDFVTSNGSFDETKTTLKKSVITDGDMAKVRLYSSRKSGSATVQATFDDSMDGEKLTKAITLKFGNLSSGQKLSACHFELICTAKNLGAYTDHNIATECFIKSLNRKLEHVDVPDVKFEAEVGRMITIEGDTPLTNRYFYIADPAKKPLDVDPLPRGSINNCGDCEADPTAPSVERCRCGLDNEIVNPRDSLVTIIAYANGEECFEDTNRNEEFDIGEIVVGTFLGEPFIDENDNGKRDENLLNGTHKEPYVDSFGGANNKYDDEDGTWNDDITVWTQTKILLTGSPDESTTTTRFETTNGDYINWVNGDDAGIHCNGSKVYYFYLMDKYMNPIATNENESIMTITMSGDDIVGNYNKENSELHFNEDKDGFEMAENGEIIKFNIDDQDSGFKYIAKVEHAEGEGCKDYEGTEAYNVRVEITTFPGLKNSEYPFSGEERTTIKKVWEFVGRINK